MGKKIDIGVGNVARKAKKLWIGDASGKARLIKKAWMGDANGKARLFFSSGELVYLGIMFPKTIDLLSNYHMSTATGKKHAFLAGGYGDTVQNGSKYRTNVYAFDESLTMTEATSGLSPGRHGACGGSIGDYTLFSGGIGVSSGYRLQVDIYDTSLTHTTSTAKARSNAASANVGEYLLITGGQNADNSANLLVTEVYDKSLTKTTAANLDKAKMPAATTVGNHAVFLYNYSSTNNSMVSYDSSLTQTITTVSLQNTSRSAGGAATIGDYAIFAGGTASPANTKGIDAFNASLTKVSVPDLSEYKRNYVQCFSLGDYVVVGGGYAYTDGAVGIIDMYDSSLTKTVHESVTGDGNSTIASRHAAKVGSYALCEAGEAGVHVFQWK